METNDEKVLGVLAITSESAFLTLAGVPSLVWAHRLQRKFFASHPIVVATPEVHAEKIKMLLEGAECELLITDPSSCQKFATAIRNLLTGHQEIDAIFIHDASRPLVDKDQAERVIAAFTENIDAIRPAIAFTETLKILGTNGEIRQTLDRTKVLHISTPELIRVSAIDFDGEDTGWFLPLKDDVKVEQVAGSERGARINSAEDRDLMELSLN